MLIVAGVKVSRPCRLANRSILDITEIALSGCNILEQHACLPGDRDHSQYGLSTFDPDPCAAPLPVHVKHPRSETKYKDLTLTLNGVRQRCPILRFTTDNHFRVAQLEDVHQLTAVTHLQGTFGVQVPDSCRLHSDMNDADLFLAAGSRSNVEVLQQPAISDCQSLAGSTTHQPRTLIRVSTKEDLHAVLQVCSYTLRATKTAADRSGSDQVERTLPAGWSRIL